MRSTLKLTLIVLSALMFYSGTAVSAPFAYVTNLLSNDVTVIDLASNQVVTTIADVGNEPVAAVSSVDGKYVYVASSSSNTVSIIEVSTNTVIDTLNVGNKPSQLAASPDGKYVYVINNRSNNVSVIDTSTNTVTGTISVGQEPEGVAFANDSLFAYVVNIADSVSVINTSTMQVGQTVENVGESPILIAVSPIISNPFAYVSDLNSDALTEIDLSQNEVSDTINLSTNNNSGDAGDLVFTPDGSTLYVCFAGSISIVDMAMKEVMGTINDEASCLAMGPSGQHLYYCNLFGTQGPASTPTMISVVDLSTNTVIDEITVGMFPSSIAITPLSDTDPTDSNGNNNSCALALSNPTKLSFPLYLLAPAFIVISRIKRKWLDKTSYS